MTEKKEPRKKTEGEKKDEKTAMVNLWMNNLGDKDSELSKKDEHDSNKK